MNVFKTLAEVYAEIDGFYVAQELIRSKDSSEATEVDIAKKRELNDHAYFLFMFTRLEDHVREASSKLIQQNSDSTHEWTHRRVWQLLPAPKDSDQMSFMNRVALLIDKGSHHYRDIRKYYELRNTIGHGGNFTTPISIPTVVKEFSLYLAMAKTED